MAHSLRRVTMMSRFLWFFLAATIVGLHPTLRSDAQEASSLAGEWRIEFTKLSRRGAAQKPVVGELRLRDTTWVKPDRDGQWKRHNAVVGTVHADFRRLEGA